MEWLDANLMMDIEKQEPEKKIKPDAKGWMAFEKLEPEESDCMYGWLMVWHVFIGVVTVRWEERHMTDMYTHWMPMPRKDWITVQERMPERQDADMRRCVLARHEEYGIKVTGWHRLQHDRRWTHWRKLPEEPEHKMMYRSRF